MNYLKLSNRPPAAIDKAVFTVGWGNGFDLSLGEAAEGSLCFSIEREGEVYHLVPGNERLRLNARILTGAETLSSCDRISWREEAAVFLSDIQVGPEAEAQSSGLECLKILERLSADLENSESLGGALRQALASMAALAGAQGGSLVSEMEPGAGWELLASFGASMGTSGSSRKLILSHTAVNEAIRLRRPVYVESIVGHDWASQDSIMGARIFSLACLPLVVGTRVFGCVYLFTHTPGKSIHREALETLSLLATQVTLLLGTRAQLNRARSGNLKSVGSKAFIFDPESGAMKALSQRLSKLAPSELSLLVLGETGSGKEVIAREIHERGTTPHGPFVAVNCAAIPPSLIESVLFGHVKGAFTGATKDQDGKFVQANGGTLFLDEIGDLAPDLQVKLLRVLQERVVEPVGGNKAVPVSFRLVAATHQDVEAQVKAGKFRQDLYYRLNGATLAVPPLRERVTDIPLLAEYFLARNASGQTLSKAAMACLQAHPWPGNVRELEQVVIRAAALAVDNVITPEDLEIGVLSTGSSKSSPLDFSEMPGDLKAAQEAFTREFVRVMLEENSGVRSKTAAQLGVSERTLYRILSSDGADRAV